ncbi:MAG TPA: hypothetical protein VMT43_11920 [Acidimicrobiales bacterium]|nr:hypothetical protein [Acidimicrobiales bacterium]
MSLSQRLKEAEQQRRRAAGLPPEPPAPTEDEAVVDLSAPSADVIDLTERTGLPQRAPGRSSATRPAGSTANGSPTPGISYDPVRHGDATSAFGDSSPVAVDRLSSYACPRCGGPTQIDLIDQVHQTVSLSCLSCFHMFRVEQG